MAKRDYYDTLGVQRNADEKELKGAFRKLAKQYHPDARPGDKTTEHKFKEINEAYDVLKDPQRRAAYDRFGHPAFEAGMAGGGARAQGSVTVERTGPSGQGRCQVISDPCSACGGAGRTTRERTLSINIPAGVEDGTRIRLAGEGEAVLRGGAAGDLYIFLSVRPHEFFQRDGADLFCKVPISMTAASLGGEIEVP